MYAVKPYFSHEIVISAKSNPMYSVKPYYDDCQINGPQRTETLVNDVLSSGDLKIKPVKPTEKKVEKPLPVSGSGRRSSSQAEEGLLEERQRKLIDRLNHIKKQLDQLQSKFRSTTSVKSKDTAPKNVPSTDVKKEEKEETVVVKKTTKENTNVKKGKTKENTESLDVRMMTLISYATFENRVVFEELAQFGENVNIAITANPNFPPFSLFILSHLINQRYGAVSAKIYTHSSVITELSEEFLNAFGLLFNSQPKNRITIHFIWMNDVPSPTMKIKCQLGEVPVEGEEVIAKFFAKVANFSSESDKEIVEDCSWCKTAQSFLNANNETKEQILKDINVHLGKKPFLLGDSLTLADVCLWSALSKAKLNKEGKTSGNVKRWIQSCNNETWFADSKKLCDIL